MSQWLNQGQFKSIPVFAFFDEDWKEVGVLIERPASVTELRAKKRREIFAKHPEFGSPDGPVDQLSPVLVSQWPGPPPMPAPALWTRRRPEAVPS